ncbi:hypothetical protein [Acetivibrio cellulolyticus]|uniref:hypothetical protein n=1 Tax=Acetivibrio cellulolyticus TaxID=35830 RepID=UPI00389960C3
MVCRDGTVVKFVDEVNAAWHAGKVNKPSSKLVVSKPSINCPGKNFPFDSLIKDLEMVCDKPITKIKRVIINI